MYPGLDSNFIICLTVPGRTLKREGMRAVAIVAIGKTPFGAFRDRDLRSRPRPPVLR